MMGFKEAFKLDEARVFQLNFKKNMDLSVNLFVRKFIYTEQYPIR